MPETYAENNKKPIYNRRFLIGLARAFGGAILFSFPLFMTMEMWWNGFFMGRFRLALFIFLSIPLLFGLSYFDGFENTNRLKDDAVDTFVAFAVGFISSAAILSVLNLINSDMSADEIIGKISLQAVIASFGALFAQSLLGGNTDDDKSDDNPSLTVQYLGQFFLMAVGAIFLSMNIAATEEMILLAYKMTNWHAIILALGTILMMHAFVYAVEFSGQEEVKPKGSSMWSAFFRYTVVGYAIVLLISFYLLWTFGRVDGTGTTELVKSIIVLSFPGALGAAASRLIL
ncbi:MAG: TIGR02587 family membrane protein [Acidobacteria bacterium]|nr:TIGR02587 family membrane protein [Acidobacteriota bacterium]